MMQICTLVIKQITVMATAAINKKNLKVVHAVVIIIIKIKKNVV